MHRANEIGVAAAMPGFFLLILLGTGSTSFVMKVYGLWLAGAIYLLKVQHVLGSFSGSGLIWAAASGIEYAVI